VGVIVARETLEFSRLFGLARPENWGKTARRWRALAGRLLVVGCRRRWLESRSFARVGWERGSPRQPRLRSGVRRPAEMTERSFREPSCRWCFDRLSSAAPPSSSPSSSPFLP